MTPDEENGAAGSGLVSHLSHRLRNPLAVIVGYAELVGARDDERTRREASQQIVAAAEQLSEALDDLLTVFALEAGLLSVEPAPVELEDVVAQTLAELRARAGDDTTFVLRPSNGAAWPVVEADAEHLAAVVRDALAHAVRWTPARGEVRVSADAGGGLARLTIATSGAPADPRRLERIFDLSAATDDADASSEGLGLYKARRLVELHGGSIVAESDAGGGATLTLTLPLAYEEDA